ncbi:MAG: hypothetical protein H6737_07500 [Alphaproteobacteria bacterium]|nr:hypothetical protein [Alphaproteobacteria bacterium]
MSGYTKSGSSINIGSSTRNTQVSSTASGGGSRDDKWRTSNGQNYEAWKFRMEQHAQQMRERIQRMQERNQYGGFMGGIMNSMWSAMDTVTDAQDMARIEEQAKAIEDANQQTQTKLEDVDPKLLEGLDKDTILRFAFSPEDMAALDLNGEHDAIAEVASVLTVNNPTPELMKHLIGSGQFQDVVWSGHGSEEGMWITNAEGKSELLPAKDMADMFKDSSVQEILLNTCDGGAAVDDALNKAGIDTFAYQREIDDKTAIEDAQQFAQSGSLADIDKSADVKVENGQVDVKSGGRYQHGSNVANLGGLMAAGFNPFAGMALKQGLGGLEGSGMIDLSGLGMMGPFGPIGPIGPISPVAAPTQTATAALTGTASAGVSKGLTGVAKAVADSGTAHAAVTPKQEILANKGSALAGLRYTALL